MVSKSEFMFISAQFMGQIDKRATRCDSHEYAMGTALQIRWPSH